MLKLFKRKGRKVFVIGLDCAPPPVIFKNSAEGPIGLKDQLPNLSRLFPVSPESDLSKSLLSQQN